MLKTSTIVLTTNPTDYRRLNRTIREVRIILRHKYSRQVSRDEVLTLARDLGQGLYGSLPLTLAQFRAVVLAVMNA